MDNAIFSNVLWLTFLLWPAAVVISALLNMLITLSFSWSELVIDYLIGMVIGLCFYFGTVGDVNAIEHLFLMISTGLFGLLKWTGFFAEIAAGEFFLLCCVTPMISVVVTGLIDYAHAAIGAGSSGAKWGNAALSLISAGFKWPFSLVTSLVGLIIGIIGLVLRATKSSPTGGGLGFIGGILWFEWGNTGLHATTFGSVVNSFQGEIKDALSHELVHTRQYLYLHDWLGVFYFTVAGLWGLISSAASSSFSVRHYFSAHGSKEIGNPLEVVPEHRYH